MSTPTASNRPCITRFAPSPNGSLHLGHAYSAIVAHDLAKASGGRFLVRIEDIDGARSRPELADEFRRDLEWLGLEWEEVPAQSTRLASYEAAFARLKAAGLVYPCRCTRADVQAAGAKMGPMGPIYPGTCKNVVIPADTQVQWRLDLEAADRLTGQLKWYDDFDGVQFCDPYQLGDVVLWRRDEPASYHLAATLDDAADGVTLVTRGRDLFEATHIHRVLQALLDLPTPAYHHHALVLDERGEKLAKRRGSPALAARREAGDDGRVLAEQLRMQKFELGT
ncbi:tRNA glutamyl-Q(34) synthetase GluQRS [Erythrobacter sp. SCSIO 43205]|uniref:tRNA glutamyl-Q(34) synthetase GluQRS n=1 Tax=Erythrobacter sp. SCSIO 43205 TaxID=2779361 RepID=UPI001CA9602E|nr:tRNA glutamyl-Q(34) synthetase GluQRS [Erythrobacter sp. SCSIO 43205]UAB78296.1 tRNA glutamyl-Q(34) synthetase GluQRS [Erythrobacter sp. SCSIO 43205]